MTNAASKRKRALEEMLGLPPKSLKSPPGFAKTGTARRGRTPLPSDDELAKMSFAELMGMMPPKKAKFVEEILKGAPREQAAAAAGWNFKSKHSRSSHAGNLLRRDPLIMAAIKAARTEVATEVKFDVAAAYQKLEDAIQFAVKTENATALARMIELQAKLFGLMVDRQDVRNLSAFSIQIEGIDSGRA